MNWTVPKIVFLNILTRCLDITKICYGNERNYNNDCGNFKGIVP